MGSPGRFGSVTTMPSELAATARSFMRASAADLESLSASAASPTAPMTSPPAPRSGS